MSNYNYYEIAIIGGGISSCVFASTHIKNGFNGSIAIIENGRNLGGRSSTRNSLANKNWQLNHGSPNFNICNKRNNQFLKAFIDDLLEAKIIQSDSSELIELYGEYKSKIKSNFYIGSNYISNSSMSELCHKIISLNNLKNQIDYYFETLIVKIEYKNKNWILTSNNGDEFRSKYLVCSSNLLLHKRSLDILKINQIPLRKAIPLYMDKKVDLILNLLNDQDYIQRLSFLIYTKSNYCYKDNYQKKYRYFLLNNLMEEKFKFERIIFQKQNNNKLGIVIHTRNIDLINSYCNSKNKEDFKINLFFKFNNLFEKNPYINKLIDIQDMSIMQWRASQPIGKEIPEDLQVCENLNIGFCGDWFDLEGFGRIEGAISSALKLSYKISSLY